MKKPLKEQLKAAEETIAKIKKALNDDEVPANVQALGGAYAYRVGRVDSIIWHWETTK